MCEFKVKLGDKVVAEEILAFNYTSSGQGSNFSDVLGRTTLLKDVLVTGVNMLPGRHEITLLQTPATGKAVELLLTLAAKSTPTFNREHAQQLLRELTDIVEKELK
ncbi:MAG: hypothetical protein RBG13Loki_1836 [Promethearchaeota archaeon CR_4]|nr:MAG: hypothetical protein RBG13Loki_1836 [Candidatus Lokiarchaeota archaeon CR_4]